MNKFTFIKDLLENNKLNQSQKDRFFKLVSYELIKSENINNTVIEDIEDLKKRIGRYEKKGDYTEDVTKDINNNPSFQVKNSINHPIIHNAPDLVNLMSLFSSNEKALKYTTHSWEFGKFESYEDFIKKISDEWKEINQELKRLNPRFHGKISNFLFHNKLGEKPEGNNYYNMWGDMGLKFGWSSIALKSYMKHQKNDPFACPIPESIKNIEKEENLLYFQDYVSVFKNEIEVREDNNALENLINKLWSNILGYDFTVTQEDIIGVSFFTDVAYLKSTLEIIFKSFKARMNYPNIICRVDKNFTSKFIELSLIQKDSVCNRDINDPKISNPNGGDVSSIINNLKNLADFSIVSRFKDDSVYKVNYLSSDNSVKAIQKIEGNNMCDGFTYKLKFYL